VVTNLVKSGIKYVNNEWKIKFRNLRISSAEFRKYKMSHKQISTLNPALSGSRPIYASDQSDKIIKINSGDRNNL